MHSQTSLTQSELQSLKSLLKKQISELQMNMNWNKTCIKDLYHKADPEDVLNGQFFFDCLNDYRNSLRKQKAQMKILSRIQKSIKEEIRAFVAIRLTW